MEAKSNGRKPLRLLQLTVASGAYGFERITLITRRSEVRILPPLLQITSGQPFMAGLICFMGGRIDPGGLEVRMSCRIETLCDLSVTRMLARTLNRRKSTPKARKKSMMPGEPSVGWWPATFCNVKVQHSTLAAPAPVSDTHGHRKQWAHSRDGREPSFRMPRCVAFTLRFFPPNQYRLWLPA